ncbi:MAG: hypothetical protein A3E07_03430 [Candidatus Wildermuthbacteria bacterium RIFCSPHIGHO2_12_FULL_45_9]|uniref:Uncharacterized protein n=1 Tax=Candidatus Wildermuthbacteria bacterium RIFCSPHIGHO2_02_FULL_45_25 TaxID=1802450 RepID=A0A1G2R230_9BACT|nr:MAG: hypothetical protein A2748_03575 [Candidatus Wildermuthbacteria bacterium RIFCSPHIGHO2_01_FULL_45_20]OHA66121.1 MAG: hypothetical protein A3C04_03735 [Candidatus Wildermuthbacteria bacterium RIFCSPHIGHO2_02_FULL_45_25]OHA71397.1 MAG: hypothetical protein A3E07_03430 [Candidatus Wildermuthbacteria bacterium RIFCSPHIGHO2_12_FULL_45_9]
MVAAVEKAVENTRNQAEKAFDEAVAVSSDGTVLVNADEALVFSGKNPPVSVSRGSFRTGKILLAGNSPPVRIQCESRAKAIQDFLASLPAGHTQEIFLTGEAGSAQKTLLLTVDRYSPSPGSRRGFGLFGR